MKFWLLHLTTLWINWKCLDHMSWNCAEITGFNIMNRYAFKSTWMKLWSYSKQPYFLDIHALNGANYMNENEFVMCFVFHCGLHVSMVAGRQDRQPGCWNLPGFLGLSVSFTQHQRLTCPSQGMHMGWSVTRALPLRWHVERYNARTKHLPKALSNNECNVLHPRGWNMSLSSPAVWNENNVHSVLCFENHEIMMHTCWCRTLVFSANLDPFVPQLSISSLPLSLSSFIHLYQSLLSLRHPIYTSGITARAQL